MGERRQVHRREPIEIVLDDGRTFVVKPLPWMQRNDLGSEILRQNTEALNESVRLYMDPELNLPQLEMRLNDKITEPNKILLLIFPDLSVEDFDNLDFEEITALMLASLDVNHLNHLAPLVDPNSPAPNLIGGITSSEEGQTEETGPKIESSPDSSSLDSVGTPSLTSPTTS
jgi:hypothetical protein